jgi:hypothetical protein
VPARRERTLNRDGTRGQLLHINVLRVAILPFAGLLGD